MPLDWLNAPLEKSLGDLVARRKYGRAIEVLRGQILAGAPGTQARLQLADLLVQAGRGQEAVPILLGLADEFARDGFAAKAVAVLKRIDKIDPGRADVEALLGSLVRPSRSVPARAPTPRTARVQFDIEEIAEEPAMAPRASERTPPVEAPLAPPAAEPALTDGEAPPPTGPNSRVRSVFRRFLASLSGGVEDAAPAEGPASDGAPVEEPAGSAQEPAQVEPPLTAALPAEPRLEAPAPLEPSQPSLEAGAAAEVESGTATEAGHETAPEAEPALATAAELVAATEAETALPPALEEASGSTDTDGVTGKIKGVFRRFLHSFATEPDTPATEAPPGTPEPEAPPVEIAATDPTRVEAAEATPPDVTEANAGTPAAERFEPPLEVEASVESEPQMSEEQFQDQVLDVIQDALLHPRAADAPAPQAPVSPGVVEDAAAVFSGPILASPLFDDLSEEELLAVVHGLELSRYGPGDVVVTEGEPGESLFIVTTGAVKVFVRNPAGRDLEVGQLGEGDFFGEISSLSGRPRTATITAAAACELLELQRTQVDRIARTHPRIREMLEAFYIQRASSPEAAAIRAVSLGGGQSKQQAIEILEAHFGESRWDPRMRLRLAEVLLKAGKDQDAVPVLIGLADDLAREGFTEKAIAILKKIERIQKRGTQEINLAPLKRAKSKTRPEKASPLPTPAPAPVSAPPALPPLVARGGATEGFFQGWLLDVFRDRVRRQQTAAAEAPASDPAKISGYARGLKASPLFEGFADDELLAVLQGLRLLNFDAGDVIITEGEPGESLFILAAGAVKVFVRNPAGHNITLRGLDEGAFFGEMSTLSSRPRTATVTAAASCELLELDRATLDTIAAQHPRIRSVLEEFYIERASSPEAAAIRSAPVDAGAEPGEVP
jgi:CRP-like cAMP-binding protein